jgi:hypothetical protein
MMSKRADRLLALMAVGMGVVGTPTLAASQRITRTQLAPAPSDAPALGALSLTRVVGGEKRRRASSVWAVLASATIPGTGQAALGQWRAVPYLALEGLSWAEYRSDSRSARRDRNAYRLLAARVARAAFGTFLPNGDFEYYERMETYLESGTFDVIPGGELQPELDTTTFNGAMWMLARRTYWKDANAPPERGSTEWQRAESFYAQRAIRPAYQWSWRGAPAEFERFKRYIRASNDSYREAVADLGVVIGNHLLSTVDAYVTVQLRRRNDAGNRRTELSVAIPF